MELSLTSRYPRKSHDYLHCTPTTTNTTTTPNISAAQVQTTSKSCQPQNVSCLRDAVRVAPTTVPLLFIFFETPPPLARRAFFTRKTPQNENRTESAARHGAQPARPVFARMHARTDARTRCKAETEATSALPLPALPPPERLQIITPLSDKKQAAPKRTWRLPTQGYTAAAGRGSTRWRRRPQQHQLRRAKAPGIKEPRVKVRQTRGGASYGSPHLALDPISPANRVKIFRSPASRCSIRPALVHPHDRQREPAENHHLRQFYIYISARPCLVENIS